MPNVLLLGNGFVAGPCLDHLLLRKENNVTNSKKLANGKCNAIAIDVNNAAELESAIAQHDLVISLIPYTFHCKVIAAAIKLKKHVVTTSYISPAMLEYDQAAKNAGVTVFNEIGVDPGIDHLYAIKTIQEVHEKGGKIVSFLSYCGGLPAPEASNNPLGYKFSWSSRGVLLALRNNARFWENGKVVETPGLKLMDIAKPIHIYPAFAFEGYPNRDSVPYTERYNIPECKNLIRGTLRYQGFPQFVKVLVSLGFLNEDSVDYLDPKAASISWKALMAKLLGCPAEQEALEQAVIEKAVIPEHDRYRIIQGLKWLGMFSDKPVALKGTLLDTLCATLEEKMMYEPHERDMVMLQHKFEIEWPNKAHETRTCTGLWFGVPGGDSAMATTVGVPCAVTAQLILDGKITRTGVLAPMTIDLVDPILERLEAIGIKMDEQII